MSGRPEVRAGPAGVVPGGLVPEAVRAEVLAGVLAGIGLGAQDRRVLAWLAGWDSGTVLTVASWIARAREAGPLR